MHSGARLAAFYPDKRRPRGASNGDEGGRRCVAKVGEREAGGRWLCVCATHVCMRAHCEHDHETMLHSLKAVCRLWWIYYNTATAGAVNCISQMNRSFLSIYKVMAVFTDACGKKHKRCTQISHS